VVYSSGYVANIAAITTFVGRGRVVISDILNHASIVDGCVLSGARHLRFRHNDMRGLERCLMQAGTAGALVVTDAVFSMDGDIADLPAISELCRKNGAALMVDEAHSIGTLGETGRGIEEYFGMGVDTIDVKMGTLSKTIPAVGGYIAGSKALTNALRHNSRPYIFSAALPPAMAAAAITSLDVIETEPERVVKLRSNVATYRQGLKALGFEVLGEASPIVPVICPSEEKAFEMTRGCISRGLLVLPIVFPAVPRRTPRLRTIVTAAHDSRHIQQALSKK
jgi:7-keto-8-aminopelargonate synthetase-like enzyme